MRRRDCLAVIASTLASGTVLADSHEMAEAINKAGRQRMLSQRMAKSYMARGQDVDSGLADRTLSRL